MATAVHPPQVRRNSLSNVPACAASMESRGICVHMHCRHGLRQLSGCSASPLSNIRSGGCRGVDSSSVASASLSPQRRTRLSLAAAPRLLLRAKPPPPTTPSLRCGTLLLSPSPAAPPRLLLLSCGERPASPLSARRPSLHPARASRAGVRVTAAWAWGGALPPPTTPSPWLWHSLPEARAALSPCANCVLSLSLCATHSTPALACGRVLCAAWAFGENPSCLRSPPTSLAAGHSPLSPPPRDR